MPLLFQHRIYRQDLINNRDVLYLFGDNEDRVGLGGQAAECRGEENAIGIATKTHPSMSEDSFWCDTEYNRCCEVINKDFEPVFRHIKNGGIVICPSDGLGTGLSELPHRAPQLFKYLRETIITLKEI